MGLGYGKVMKVPPHLTVGPASSLKAPCDKGSHEPQSDPCTCCHLLMQDHRHAPFDSEILPDVSPPASLGAESASNLHFLSTIDRRSSIFASHTGLRWLSQEHSSPIDVSHEADKDRHSPKACATSFSASVFFFTGFCFGSGTSSAASQAMTHDSSHPRDALPPRNSLLLLALLRHRVFDGSPGLWELLQILSHARTLSSTTPRRWETGHDLPCGLFGQDRHHVALVSPHGPRHAVQSARKRRKRRKLIRLILKASRAL